MQLLFSEFTYVLLLFTGTQPVSEKCRQKPLKLELDHVCKQSLLNAGKVLDAL